MRYVALLRGINVGGNNLIPMKALKASFERLGLADVSTYIASGNVLFTAPAAGRPALVARIERALSQEFGYAATVVVRSHAELRAVVEGAPDGFGTRPGRRYDVLFLKEPLAPAAALDVLPRNPEVDEAHAGPHVVYFSRLDRLASKSKLSRAVSLPIYKSLTIRNWNTTARLLGLLDAGA